MNSEIVTNYYKKEKIMSYMKSILVAVLVLLCIADGVAADVGAEAARTLAMGFLRSQNSGKLMARGITNLQLVYTEPSSARDGSADYYVFDADGKAFVIVAGDDRAEGILGYGDGTIDVTDVPCNMQWLLNSYKEQIEWLHANPKAIVKREAPYHDVSVAPMLTCDWSQRAPYNNQCPEYNGERSVTGCVATAMAQVMYYWRYPYWAPALSGYTTREHGITLPPLPGKKLDWDNMIDNYAVVQYTEEQANAVATLMRYCGQSCQMDYSPDGSGAYVYQQAQGMRAHGYHSTRMVERSSYNVEDWDDMMQREILASRPILYSGNDALSGGHAFVLDGYYGGKYHINWGWAGTGNGYFALDAFYVEGYGFNGFQQMLINVYPDDDIEPEDGYDFEQDGVYYMYSDDNSSFYVTYRDTKYDCYSGEVTIPSQVTYDGETLPVTGIGRSAFRNCTNLTAVTLPPTLTVIEDYAFRNCISLSRVTLPEGVTTICPQVFANCLNLEWIELPASLTSIGDRAFLDCNALSHVEIPTIEAWLGIKFTKSASNPLYYAHHLTVAGAEVHDLVVPASVGTVSPYAFVGFEELTSLTLEEGVTAVGVASFAYCTGLASLSLPSTLTTIDDQVFYGCTALENVVLPNGLSHLNYAAFATCKGLKTVSISSGLTAIDDYAFYQCANLKSVDLPASITSIGSNSFNGCTALAHVSIPAGLKTMGDYAFAYCENLQEVNLPDSLLTIGKSAFIECFGLTSLVIPNMVTAISQSTFFKCVYLKTLTLGEAVETIADRAFDNNPRLTSITCLASTPPKLAAPSCFMHSIYDKAVLYVPAGLQQTYKHSGIWGWFANIEPILTTVAADVNRDGEITVADVNAVISTITTGIGDLTRDVNGDGEVSIADANAVISIILRSEP